MAITIKSKVSRSLYLLMLSVSMTPVISHAGCFGMQVHAHRGASSAPENSVSALRTAYEGNWDGVETDMQVLMDGQWVIHHDAMTGRVVNTGSRMSTHSLTSSDWQHASLIKNGQIQAEHPPFVHDVLALANAYPNKTLNAEIKDIVSGCGPIQSLVSQFKQQMQHGNWFMTSGVAANLKCARAADPDGYLGLIVFDLRHAEAVGHNALTKFIARNTRAPVLNQQRLQAIQQEIGMPVGIHVDAKTMDANPVLLSDAGKMGMPVFVYAVDGDAQLADSVLRAYKRTARWPSGVIIDGGEAQFCGRLSP